MKISHIITLTSFFLLFNSCISRLPNNKDSYVEESVDTIVETFDYPKDISGQGIQMKKFFMISKGDTSDFYFDVSFFKLHDKVRFSIKYNPISSDHKSKEQYVDQLKELEYMFSYLSTVYNLNRLEAIQFDAYAIIGLSKDIGQAYLKQNKDLDVIQISDVVFGVENSKFLLDLKGILQDHSLMVDKVWVWEGLIYTNLKDLKMKTHNQFLKDFEVGGTIVLNLAQIIEN